MIPLRRTTGRGGLLGCKSWLPIVLALMSLWSCSEDGAQPGFTSPAVAYRTYVQAVLDNDGEGVWHCFSASYRRSEYGGDRSAWQTQWQSSRAELGKRARNHQIADERLINERIGYVLIDASTLSSQQQSPFYYFVRDPDGWKMTSFMDSTFHAELESSIELGEFEIESW